MGCARNAFTEGIKYNTCNFFRLLCEEFKLVCGISFLPLWSHANICNLLSVTKACVNYSHFRHEVWNSNSNNPQHL